MPEGSILYPVAGIEVQAVGGSQTFLTDRAGKVQVSGLPADGRLIVKYDHSEGRILTGLTEVVVDNVQAAVPIVVSNYNSFDFMSSVNRSVQNADLSSFCGRVRRSEDVSGLEVSLTLGHDGPFYFNKFGPDKL